MRRNLTIGIAALDCLAAVGIAASLFSSGSDPATRGFDIAGGWLVVVLLLVTGAPALLLALLGRALKPHSHWRSAFRPASFWPISLP